MKSLSEDLKWLILFAVFAVLIGIVVLLGQINTNHTKQECYKYHPVAECGKPETP